MKDDKMEKKLIKYFYHILVVKNLRQIEAKDKTVLMN